MPQIVLEVRNLSQSAYPGSSVRRTDADIFRDVNFELFDGEALGIVGHSGAGKTTLARALLQSPRPTSGSLILDNRDWTLASERDLRRYRQRVQMVFQNPFGSLDPRWTVSRIIEEPLVGFGIGNRRARRDRVDEAMTLVQLEPAVYRNRVSRRLSGGECQRVAIARALVLRPRVLVCDEALCSLDVIVQAQILALFRRLKEQLRLSVIYISHDLRAVRRFCERAAVLSGGRMSTIGPTDSVLSDSPLHSAPPFDAFVE